MASNSWTDLTVLLPIAVGFGHATPAAASPNQAPEGCSSAITESRLDAWLHAAWAAAVVMDDATFPDRVAEAREAARCVRGALDPGVAAELHLLDGILAFTEEREEDARLAFQSAVQADATISLPDELAPADHPLWALLADARELGPGRVSYIPSWPGATFIVDGVVGGGFPVDRPSVFQVVGKQGDAASTAMLRDISDLRIPTHLCPKPAPCDGAHCPPCTPCQKRHGLQPTLWGVAGGLGVTAVGMWWTSWATAEAYNNLDANDDARVQMQRANTAAIVLAGAFGAAGAGTGVAALVTTKW